ncbi:MAG: HAD hydrolase-like protein [Myxococcales bacterium]|nr:HAD hydrolase-like protein [Myxococcales bacterium]
MHIQLVVFDMAGTTVADDADVAFHLREAVKALGVSPTLAQVNAVMGWPKPLAIRTLLEDQGLAATEPEVECIHRSFVDRMVRFYRTHVTVAEVPGTTHVFRWLKMRGVKVALDTGFSRPICHAIVERLGWADEGLLDATATSDEVALGRPAPDLIHLAMRRARVTDASCVVKVGDTPSDLEEGRRAGCGMVIGVTRGSHSSEQLAVCRPDYLVPTVESLPDLFYRLSRERAQQASATV